MHTQFHYSTHLTENLNALKEILQLEQNFDLIYRTIVIGGKDACFVYINGFCKDELLEKILQFFLECNADDFPSNPYAFLKEKMPYIEVDRCAHFPSLCTQILSGVFALMIDGYPEAILIDTRTYPTRNIAEPDREKSLRGSKDGFVETLIFNTALIRRRIRSPQLMMKHMQVGEISKTDLVLCYLADRIDPSFLQYMTDQISSVQCDALTVSQETLAELLFHKSWLNPFPKVRFSERPDTTCAQILEGNLAIIIDNSPYVMLLPSTIYDFLEEADDYYFPPITGTYLRITRFLIAIFSYLLAPTFLLMTQYSSLLPPSLQFLLVSEGINVPIFLQFLIMELAIDGLRLASVNTPSMLSTPLSVLAGLVLGEFSVSSGFFNREVMLIMAFVAVANYTQTSYELGYAFKFMRLITLVLTFFFHWIGFAAGVVLLLTCIITNRTISDTRYIAPLKKNGKFGLLRHLIRRKL